MKLTSDQQQTVADNHDLIYWYARHKNVDLEEYYDLLAIELCLTVMNYDATKSSLSNYFKIRADNRMNKEYAKQMTQKRRVEELVSLDELYDVGFEEDATDDLFSEHLQSKDEFGILRMKYNGMTQSAIAEKLGVSQSFVSRKLNEMKLLYYKGRE